MNRGKYIVIEGNDGTGKSTQVNLLSQWLEQEKGIKTFVTHEPDGPGICAEIRTILKNGDLERDGETNLLLFTASRREMWRRACREIALGTWVLSARNYISTLAYQGYGEGVDTQRIIEITHRFVGNEYCQPDMTLILDIHEDERKRRIAQRGDLEVPDTFESRDQTFQDKLNNGYRQIAAEYDFPLIDASQSIDDIQTEIRRIIDLQTAA